MDEEFSRDELKKLADGDCIEKIIDGKKIFVCGTKIAGEE